MLLESVAYARPDSVAEALDLLSRAVRAGHAFQTAMGMVADELAEPVGPEFKKAFDRQNFGLPLREALDAFVASTQTEMTGSVTLSLYKGNVSVVSRQSEHSLYRTDLSSFTMGDSYDQKDAAGFIRILGLPSRTRARARVEVAR